MNRLDGLTDIFLQPGEHFVANANYQMRTMLGSCVSITIWHPATRTGAMSHFLLPTRGASMRKSALDGRYGDEALQLMLDELTLMGIASAQCQAKIFGGGNMFPQQMHASSMNIGQRNGEAAVRLLRRASVPIVSESLFGIGHRQIIFDVSTGDVWSSQIAPAVGAAQSQGDILCHA